MVGILTSYSKILAFMIVLKGIWSVKRHERNPANGIFSNMILLLRQTCSHSDRASRHFGGSLNRVIVPLLKYSVKIGNFPAEPISGIVTPLECKLLGYIMSSYYVKRRVPAAFFYWLKTPARP